MSESLGVATLTIETKDQGFSAGVNEARGKAEALGGAMDATSARADVLGRQMGAAGGSATRFAREMGTAHAASGAARAGMLQLSQQLGDVSTMFALGARPSQIFASQIGQVVGAVQLMTGGTSRLAAFLGGPWGMALTTATVVLAPLVGKLFETSAAMEKVEFASNAMGDAQGILGRVMDLTTGKINTQNAALVALARAQLAVAQIQSRVRMDQARNEISDMGTVRTRLTGTMMGFGLERTGAYENQVTRDLFSGVNNPDEALRRLQDLRKTGKINEDTFVKLGSAIANYGVEKANQDIYDQALGALDGKGLGSLARTNKAPNKRAGKSGPSAAEIEAQYEKDLARLNEEELRARMDMASDAGERLAIQQQLLASERETRIAEVEANKNFTAAQKKAQIEVINRLYGKPGSVGPDGITVDGRPGLLGLKANRDFDREDARLKNDMLARQEETLRAWARIAPDTDSRARFERRALEIHQEIERNMLEQAIASGQVADAERARAELASQQAAQRAGLAMDSAGPLATYTRGLRMSRAARGDRVEQLVVDELDYVNQSIDNAIMGRLGVKDPLLAGLIDMLVKDLLIRPMAEALEKARQARSGGGGGFLGSLFGALLGGAGTSASEAARLAPDVSATMSDPAFAGLFADGGLIPAGGWGIVGEAGPEPVFATAGGVGVLPNSALRQMGPRDPASLTFDLRGAVMTEDLLRQMNEIAAASTSQGLRSYDRGVGARAQENLGRFG